MLIRVPCHKLRQVIEYVARVRVKNMRPVFVHENASGIRMIIRVPANVIASIAE